jgi:threonine/homoserine/homoserine lactone efflux protein
MTLTTYLLYLLAVTVLIVTPGPTMLMTLSNSLALGPARALASLGGALAASFGIMVLSALGLGALLAASATAFTVLKVTGAAYLIWLGIRTFRGTGSLDFSGTAAPGRGSLFMQGVLVGASNPKSLLFFTAFFPQFIEPSEPFAPQFLLLSLTFVLGDFMVLGAATFGVGRVRPWLQKAHVVRSIQRTCGGLFALLGALLLFSRRPA